MGAEPSLIASELAVQLIISYILKQIRKVKKCRKLMETVQTRPKSRITDEKIVKTKQQNCN